MKLDVAKRLSGPLERYLFFGRAIGVIESSPRRPALGQAPKIVDGLRIVEPALNAVEPRLAKTDQRREVTRFRHPPFDHCATVGQMEFASDPFDLQRFVDAQAQVYASVVDELRAGRKRSHWIWFIFPQIAGLGSSATAARYAISSLDEARAYLRHDVLGPRLRECTQLVNAVQNRSTRRDLRIARRHESPFVDDVVRPRDRRQRDFVELLARYCDGQEDPLTLQRLG